MTHTLEVVKRCDDHEWEVFVDGNQTGRYTSAVAAKAAARRRMSPHTERIKWTQRTEEHWIAVAS